MKESWRSAIPAGLTLAQGSEFLFALLALSVRYMLVDESAASVIISIVIISMVLTPLLIKHGPNIIDSAFLRIGRKSFKDTEDHHTIPEHHKKNHILILGFGRVGQTIARFLRPLNIEYIALETDDVRIREASAAEEPVFYGDSGRLDILKAAGAAEASVVVVTFSDNQLAGKIVANAKHLNPNVPVLVRTRDDSSLGELLEAGAMEVIPETHEASLTLVSHILLIVEYPTRMIQSMIDKARRDRYQMLKGFYHGERLGFLSKEAPRSEIIHAVRLTENAFGCGKKLLELELPFDLKIVEVHRGSLVMPCEDTPELELKAEDVVVIRGLAEQIDPGENYLMQG